MHPLWPFAKALNISVKQRPQGMLEQFTLIPMLYRAFTQEDHGGRMALTVPMGG
jgi:hypothetical protein